MKCDKKFIVEAHRHSAKHQQSSFHEIENRTLLKHAVLDFADKLLFVPLQTYQFVF